MFQLKKIKRRTAVLLIGVVCSIIISLALFIVLGVSTNKKSTKTINSVGETFMAGIGSQMVMRYNQVIEERTTMVETLHTTYSSDSETVNGDLAFAAKNRGFDYLAFAVGETTDKSTTDIVLTGVSTTDEGDDENDNEVKGLTGPMTGMIVGFCAIIMLTLIVLFVIYFYFNRKNVQQLEKARAAAENANKAKSEFLSNVAHDIRTPLNAIVGMTAIATANIDDKEQVLNCLKKISLSSCQLLELIDDVKAKNEADDEADKKEIDLTGKRILVAEDNDLNREIAELLLTGAGLEVDHAENGQDCLDKFLSKKPGYYDAILMDIRMPVMNGLETTAYIRGLNRKYKSIPIIAMTADAFSEDIQKCLDCGMNAHIPKPIDIETVKATLAKFIKTDE